MNLNRIQRAWDELGRKDPLWAILTWPGKRGHGWDRGEFFETGERDVERLIGYIDSVGHSFSRRRALGFGCGVGRMTQPLARHFDEAYGRALHDRAGAPVSRATASDVSTA